MAESLLGLYKGTKKVSVASKFPNLETTRMMIFRPYERAWIGTRLDVEFDTKLITPILSPFGELVYKRGLIAAALYVNKTVHYNEMGIILYNSTPFNTSLKLGEQVGWLSFQQKGATTLNL